MAQACAHDESLDVACGAGQVVIHFAKVARFATGVDLTPAMLVKARERQHAEGLRQVRWDLGDVSSLPYPDPTFSIVPSRCAFHHFEQPQRVLDEMVRVCKPGGHLAVADICLPDDSGLAEAFNRQEAIHDPSHVKALTESQWQALWTHPALTPAQVERYTLSFPLGALLKASGLVPDAARAVETRLHAAVGPGELQDFVRLESDGCHFVDPIALMSGLRKA